MEAQRTNRRTTPYDNIFTAWRAQVTSATSTPGVKRALLNQEHELLPRFARLYTKLSALPRRARRALQRQWKHSLLTVLANLGILSLTSREPLD